MKCRFNRTGGRGRSEVRGDSVVNIDYTQLCHVSIFAQDHCVDETMH